MPTWSLSLKPYEVQLKALRKANLRSRYAYFLEMGLGKTAIVLAEALTLIQQNKINGLVVICPNSLKSTWFKEAEKVGAQFSGKATWPYTVSNSESWMQTMNYEAVITPKGGSWLRETLGCGPVMLVLDESIHVKNYKAKRTKSLIALAKDAAYVRILSGAPVVAGPQDLWGQLRVLDATHTNYFAFRNHFCVMGGWQGKQVVGTRNEEELHTLLQSVGFRAKKSEWLDLPEKIYTTRDVEMNGEQLRVYHEMSTDFVTQVREQEVVTAEMVLTQMQKLQQIGSGFLMNEKSAYKIGDSNPKLTTLYEILEEITGKAIIFTFYRHSTMLLRDSLRAPYLMGGMKPREIEENVDQFNNGDAKHMVVQIQTGKYGHTFLGSEQHRCSTSIFYENSFSLDARLQAEDRNHRIGQDRAVVYVDLMVTPLDRITVDALQKKQDVANAIVDGVRQGRV